MIYQFAFHDNVPKEPPSCKMFDLYNKLENKEQLTREDKDFVANGLYGLGGCKSSTYRRGGWAAPFHQVLNRYIVKQKYHGWSEYYAPDRTSLRKVLRGVIEITQ